MSSLCHPEHRKQYLLHSEVFRDFNNVSNIRLLIDGQGKVKKKKSFYNKYKSYILLFEKDKYMYMYIHTHVINIHIRKAIRNACVYIEHVGYMYTYKIHNICVYI